MTKRTKRIIIWSIALAFLTALAIPKLTSSKSESKASTPARGGGGTHLPITVKAVVVAPSRLDDGISVTGTISPNEQIELQSEVAGKIVGIHFKEGTSVQKGQLLVTINDSELQAQLTRANYHKQLAEVKEKRQKQLREKDAVSQAEYDVALNELNTAGADIALIETQIAKTRILAPFSGTVGLRYVSLGSYISPSTKIATLSSITPVKIDFAVPEQYFNLVQKGSRINFRVQGSGEMQAGTVYAVEPKIDQSTRTLQVRAICPNSNGRIMPGAFAEINLVLRQIDETLMIPTEAVIPDIQGTKVFVSKAGKAESRAIEIGIRTDRSVQILRGLAPGDTVITTGILQVKPGSPLKILTME